MRVLEEREKKHLNSERNNTKLLVIKPPRSLFKVVVNNYRQKENQSGKQKEEISETIIMDHHQGLPPQPIGYLKFPEHDWF
jgi:hypothetical protein